MSGRATRGLRPLAGLRVVVTRAEEQAGGFAAAFAAAGADVALFPLLALLPPADARPLERAASELPLYDWMAFTSANAVAAFLPRAGGTLPGRLRVAAVGPATAEALRQWGIEPALVAVASRGEALAAALAPLLRRGQRVLLPQAGDARPQLAEALRAAGAEAVAVVAYEKRLPPGAADRAGELFAREVGWVTFTSPRIVRHFLEVAPGAARAAGPVRLRAASLGPVTSAALRTAAIEPAAEARRPGARALVEAVVAAVGVPRSSGASES
jgi:uroporphyrinogen-III synthase/uroporphyrinogen III methyltransferase/synthase